MTDIVNFFEKLAGRWFSQRTTHYLTEQTSKAGKSELEIDFLAPDQAAVTRLCNQASVDPGSALCGLSIAQKSTIEGHAKQRIRTTLIVPVADEDNTTGRLLYSEENAPRCTYQFEQDVLTLTTADDRVCTEERWWFITDNLRMRTQMVKPKEGPDLASFCSEIRLGAKPPQP
ncbi:MAG: phycobiliprotein lyase [Cyanobacteria bacterium P01_A01_bin.105]